MNDPGALNTELPDMQSIPLDLLRCPVTGETLEPDDEGGLVSEFTRSRYSVSDQGIPLFADEFCSDEAQSQQAHYDRVAEAYAANLAYPHTEEYMNYLDRVFLKVLGERELGTVAEICCGRGEAFRLLGDRIERGLGIDVSLAMLEQASRDLAGHHLSFVQGDATRLPLADSSFDHVFMLGGIHHVNDRAGLFSEVRRILRPGGRFVFREPLDDFFFWRWVRVVIYRLSPALDHEHERPLRYSETAPVLQNVGLKLSRWDGHGLLGFCVFMNSDVLVVNRLFRYVPGIRWLTRLSTRIDAVMLRCPLLSNAALQVVGVAENAEPGTVI